MKQTLAGIAAIILIALAYTHMPLEWRRHKDIELGNRINANIERYRLIYDDGYDPPYLLWDSQEQQWHLEQSSLKTTQDQQ